MSDFVPGRVSFAYPFGAIAPEFHHSCWRLLQWDANRHKRLDHGASLIAVSTTDIAGGRSTIAGAFLEQSDAEWLAFVDTDQEFGPDVIDRLVEGADPIERPILSALVYALRPEREVPVTPACIVFGDPPEEGAPPNPMAPVWLPPDRYWQVGAVGTGCCVIHRTVLEAVLAKFGRTASFAKMPWREQNQQTGEWFDSELGEDYSFCIRAKSCGFDSWVDTRTEVGHKKTRMLSSADFASQPMLHPDAVPPRTYAVIPVKVRNKTQRTMSKDLVRRLLEDGDCDGVIVVDNASTDRDWLDWLGKQEVHRVDAEDGVGIHAMWNAGAQLALQFWPKVNLAFLNNDLTLDSDHVIGTLAAALRSRDNLVAVCPNYDGRPGEAIEQVDDICAEHYFSADLGRCGRPGCTDAHLGGGLAGFAFMVRGELFQAGYAFPETMKWWFGDNDFVLTARAMGGWLGIVHDARITHLGRQTGDWDDPAIQPQLAADRAAFEAKWSTLQRGAA